MKANESSQPVELNANHPDMDPDFGAGLRGFIIAHEQPLLHQPARGSFDDTAAWQELETRDVVGAFYDFDRQLWTISLDPLGEDFTHVTL